MSKVIEDCIFCKIIAKEVPAEIVYEDDLMIAFKDINPQAKVHILLVPKVHIPNNLYLEGSHKPLIGHIILKANEIAKKLGIAETGFRLIVNNGTDAGQEVPHIHWHLLGGEPLGRLICK
ncbi:histidine triad (HIT) family protein [Hydrogenothermus marinus]|uniref:Histidine triad (HIT) family protein n=1 Tax=Hydrogenothermus marinus TaxID=133270 RepID=A0A3M0BKN3_9AQUI|nr:histidine triad nucleotide-binding protein [Hydrogenothermus marinus]RMA97687.1 histidine triad (HIT) family protein [Hydrogenothermus marinus]